MGQDVVELVFDVDGTVRYIHSDDAATIAGAIGTISTRRASYVEPGYGGTWWVDLRLVDGPVLGPYPADQHAVALADERAWLRENWLVDTLPRGYKSRDKGKVLCEPADSEVPEVPHN